MDGSIPTFCDTHIAHYIIAALLLISVVLSIFSRGYGAGLRALSAIAFGGSLSLLLFVLVAHFVFPAGPMPPGAMP